MKFLKNWWKSLKYKKRKRKKSMSCLVANIFLVVVDCIQIRMPCLCWITKNVKCSEGTALQRAQNVMSNKNIDHPMLIVECHHCLVHWSLWKKAQFPLSRVAEVRLPIPCLTHCRTPQPNHTVYHSMHILELTKQASSSWRNALWKVLESFSTGQNLPTSAKDWQTDSVSLKERGSFFPIPV